MSAKLIFNDKLLSDLSKVFVLMDTKQKKHISYSLGRKIKQLNRQRIRQQKNTDGSSFAPRKPRVLFVNGKKKKVKNKKKLLTKMLAEKTPKGKKTTQTYTWDYTNGTGVRVKSKVPFAAVHQYGKTSTLKTRQGTITFKMPKREVLGLSKQDTKELTRHGLKEFARYNAFLAKKGSAANFGKDLQKALQQQAGII